MTSVKEATRLRHEAFIALEQAQKNYRIANEGLEEAKKEAAAERKIAEAMANLSKSERKRYRENLKDAERLIATWTEREALEWYVCGRKKLHFKYADALAASLEDPGLNPYLCIYCTGFHNGHGSHTNTLPNPKWFYKLVLAAVHKARPYKTPKELK